MSKFRFTHTDVEHHQSYKVELEVSGELSIDDLLTEFGHFLKGCGYSFKGGLEVVEDD